MKRALLLFLAFTAAWLAGCDKQDDGPAPELTLSGGTEKTLATGGGSESVTFTTNTTWSAEIASATPGEWCRVSPESGGAGTATVTVTAEANPDTRSRTAVLTIRAGGLTETVTFTQGEKGTVSLAQKVYQDIPAEGLSFDILFDGSLDCDQYGAKVLIGGAGDIGSSLAVLCKAMGAETLGIRRNAGKPAPGIDRMYTLADLDRLLPECDVVALVFPRSPETDGLMNEERLRRMKPDAVLLNGGRGTAVDCDALARVLAEGRLYGAGLDVTEPEPLPAGHPLWSEPRAVITPHVAGGNSLAITADKIAGIALENLTRYLAGEQPANRLK